MLEECDGSKAYILRRLRMLIEDRRRVKVTKNFPHSSSTRFRGLPRVGELCIDPLITLRPSLCSRPCA
jgi:hypothetical protein